MFSATCLVARTVLLAALGLGSAQAAVISGTGTLGSFTGTLTYTAATSTAATLSISLTNTSLAANSGYITAFALNNPNNQVTSISSFTDALGGGSFSLIALTSNGVSGTPNGQFDFGATTGGGFEGGGAPRDGIAVGASDSFAFRLTGSNLLALTANSFLAELSTGTGSGGGVAALDVRFRGFANGGSDKVVLTSGTGGGSTGGTPVPEPVSATLLGAGLVGLGAARRRAK